jgi:hypothetical protein
MAAASTTYKLSPTTASTFGSIDLIGCQSVTVSESADETLLQSDGKRTTINAFYDNLTATASVELTQPPKTIRVGDVGTLTLRGAERATGDGVSAVVYTMTSVASGAVVSSFDTTISHGGNSTCTIVFRMVSIDGSADVFSIS